MNSSPKGGPERPDWLRPLLVALAVMFVLFVLWVAFIYHIVTPPTTGPNP